MPEFIEINGSKIAKGETKQVPLNSYSLPTHNKIEIPVSVYRSLNDGPTVLLLAGMHGEELNGIEIIRRLLIRNIFNHLRCGTVITIPVINVISFLYGSRELPDGKDLNRCFPGSETGSLGSRIAHDLMEKIIPQIDIGIDFHTGGASISNYPQIRCVFNDATNIELAEKFGAPFTLNSPFRDKSLRKEAARIGKHILVYEGGESARWDEFSINEGVDGCLRLLNSLGMTHITVPDNKTKILPKTTWVRARHSGLFYAYKKYGAFIRKDEVIGAIADPFGEVEYKIKSPANGYIVGLNNKPMINQGDAVIHVGIDNHLHLTFE
jgi:predicted deacylase